MKVVKKNLSKQKVVDAAISLFFQKGFDGTSVRDIASKAEVNVSLISYYFQGKQGLLEYAVTDYYEQYLEVIEENLQKNNSHSPLIQLKKLITVIIKFKQSNVYLSSVIHRELSLDTMFVREMTVTYLAKEDYYLKNLFIKAIRKKNSRDQTPFILQLKGMLMTPYILHHEWRQHVIGDYSHKLFVKSYVQSIHDWLDFLVEKT